MDSKDLRDIWTYIYDYRSLEFFRKAFHMAGNYRHNTINKKIGHKMRYV